MSIFKSILARIFPSSHPANTQAPAADASATAGGVGTPASSATGGTGTAVPSGTGGIAGTAAAPGEGIGAGAAGATTATPAASTSSAMPEVDVRAVLMDLQSKNPQKLNWETSIVDLMKLLGLDSSLTARKSLATELGYTGDMDDSAAMNIWLHKQVMTKLAENGGKVPDDLKH